jgi:hypothetical protein
MPRSSQRPYTHGAYGAVQEVAAVRALERHPSPAACSTTRTRSLSPQPPPARTVTGGGGGGSDCRCCARGGGGCVLVIPPEEEEGHRRRCGVCAPRALLVLNVLLLALGVALLVTGPLAEVSAASRRPRLVSPSSSAPRRGHMRWMCTPVDLAG